MSRREHIKESAAKLFREKGYKASSMQEIADAVGIKAASLYNHIQSKQEILKELLIDMADKFTAGMQEINKSSLNSIEKLEQLVSLHIKLTYQHPDAIALITGEWVHLEEPELGEYSSKRKAYENQFKKIINSCKTDGYINPNVDTEIALYSILSTLHWLYSWQNKNHKMNAMDMEKQLKTTLLEGLKISKK